MPPQRPRIVGLPTRLRFGELIGIGATATVWRARDLHTGDDVVVKVIDVDAAGDRLEREARALARLRGVPGVLGVLELGRSPDGSAWMVTELAPGGALRDRRLDADAARRVTLELATALAAAHDRRVVHGDVSPGNVLFGADGAALLADFGAADLDGVGNRVHQGLTPAFAPPERRRGADASPAGDVYSLAASVASVCDEPDAALGGLWERCLDDHPGRRPSAADVRDALVARSERPDRWRPWRR